MREDWIPDTPELLGDYLRALYRERKRSKSKNKSLGTRRKSLYLDERKQIFSKTEGKCHICGGAIDGKWEADHVLAHSGGGLNSVNNYLPAHRLCNNYRWDYIPEEFHEIMRLGVWLRTQIQNETKIGMEAAEKFIKYEKQRIIRRRTKS